MLSSLAAKIGIFPETDMLFCIKNFIICLKNP